MVARPVARNRRPTSGLVLRTAAVCVALLGARGAAAGSASDSTAAAPSIATADPLAPPPPAGWDTLSQGLSEEARLRIIHRARYNRVDGPALLTGVAYDVARGEVTVLEATIGYAFSRDRILGEVMGEIPFGDPIRLRIGGRGYRRTATEDGWIVGETENTIFALLARTDYRDHWEAEGGSVHIAWEPGRDLGIDLAAKREELRSLPVETRVSAVGRDDRFRDNPAVDEGMDGVAAACLRIGPSKFATRGGLRGTARYERAGKWVHGAFDYDRLAASIHYLGHPGPTQELRARAIATAATRGHLPSQREEALGGIGTLRGHPFQRIVGDQSILANVEYYVLIRKNIYGLLFLDSGAAWFGRSGWDRIRPEHDAGAGIRISEGPIFLTLARRLDASNAPFIFGVRLGGSFWGR